MIIQQWVTRRRNEDASLAGDSWVVLSITKPDGQNRRERSSRVPGLLLGFRMVGAGRDGSTLAG